MIISSRKYACETCIKGHRSSSCKHTDRPLFEIKKKGRPVTQCEHCRELRKTKQVHVKCICESRTTTEPSSSSSSSKQVPKPGFESAAFPNGLPEALEASVAFQSLAEGTSSDSDHGGAHTCKSGDPCTCVMPRRSSNKKKGGGVPPEFEQQQQVPRHHEQQQQLGGHHHSTTRTSSQILARIAELRPVLPRPSHQDGFNQGLLGPVHLPSTGISHAHPSRHPEHVFKPYERAYGMTHQHPGNFHSYLVPGPSNSTFGFNDQNYNGQMMGAHTTNNPWSSPPPRQHDDVVVGIVDNDSNFPSLCGCGDGCRCPGCLQHNPRSTSIPPSSAYSSCSNPSACGACLDCTILSLPPSAIPPPDTALSIYDSQPDAIDDWLRQMLSSTTTTSTESFSNYPPPPNGAQQQQFQQPPQSWGGNNRPFSYSDQQQSNLDPTNPRVQSPFAYGRSPPPPPPSMGFVTSGERSCDYSQQQQQRGHRAQSPMSIDPRLLPANNNGGMASYYGPPRSRSPSSSSQSSHQSSQDNNQQVPSRSVYRPSERVQGIFSPPPTTTTTRTGTGSGTAPTQMNIRHLINRGPPSNGGGGGSSSASPCSGSGSGSGSSSSSRRPPPTPRYAGAGDAAGSGNPSLGNLRIY